MDTIVGSEGINVGAVDGFVGFNDGLTEGWEEVEGLTDGEGPKL